MRKLFLAALYAVPGFIFCALPLSAQVNRPPKIEHVAVTVALTGQPLMIRARITDESGEVRSATLYYAVSKDAAPFSVVMQPAGATVYIAAVPESVLSGIQELSYYIEAEDQAGVTSETAWYPVKVQKSSDKMVSDKTGASDTKSTRAKWTTPALIIGGSAVVIGGVLAAANSGGGGGSGTHPNADAAGIYTGSSTTCYQPPSGVSSCSSSGITIAVNTQGVVSSSSLHPGSLMEDQLSGSGFVLTASINDPAQKGEIQYLGTVADGRIAGTIQGSVTTPDGVGTYSGAFSASRK